MKYLIVCLAVLGAVVAEAASYTVSHVTVRQRWPWSHLVDVDYVLDASDGQAPADLTVTFREGETEIPVPAAALSGDVLGVSPGVRCLTFDPHAAGLPEMTYTAFHVQLTAEETPLYLVVDLAKAQGEDGQLTPISRSALESGAWGSCETNPVPSVASLVWTAVTNDAAYATTKLVLRRINPGAFLWGGGHQGGTSNEQKQPGRFPATNRVTLTQPYYIGVFELTQAQWKNVMGSYQQSYYRLNRDRRPCEQTLPAELRGSSANWPETGYAVGDGTILKTLRDKTGLVFDLPTEAQWEYAARAGVATAYSDNVEDVNNVTDEPSRSRIQCLGRFSSNGGATAYVEPSTTGGATVDVDHGTAIVGSSAANAWGLYDVHGNVREWVLDYRPASAEYVTYAGVDPAGCAEDAAAEGLMRIQKGGCFLYDVDQAYFGHRWASSQQKANYQSGFRVVAFPAQTSPKTGSIRP